MTGSSNFVEVNPGRVNSDTDEIFTGKTTTTEGLADGIADTTWHNKAFRQWSVMVAAIGAFIKDAGSAASDVDMTALKEAFLSALSSLFAPISKGVTNGDSHTHVNGDGAALDHFNLAHIGNATHQMVDFHMQEPAPHTGHAPIANGVIGGNSHNHAGSGGPGVQIPSDGLAADVRPGCCVYNSEGISSWPSAWYPIDFDAEVFDDDNIHESVTHPNRLTCRTAGKYLIMAHISYESDSTGVRGLRIRLNGFEAQLAGQTGPPSLSGPTDLNVTAYWPLAVNDYVVVEGLSITDTGSARAGVQGISIDPKPTFSMVRVD